MLARIAHELYWLGRNLARAEFTARAVEGIFQAELQGARESGVTIGWDGLLAILGDTPASDVVTREVALSRLTLDADWPGSVRAHVERGREGARTVRDVISTDMWEAVNMTALTMRADEPARRAAPGGPYASCRYVKERAALIWGLADRTMLRDEGKSFLDAGGRNEAADMVLRMLRVALPAGERAAEAADGQALALLQAVGGFHAYLRAVPAPPNARPVARFLLFERTYPDSVAAAVDAFQEALTHADSAPRNSEPVLRLGRLAADLDFQRRALEDDGELLATCEAVQQELARVDQDVAERYFAGAAAPASVVS